jgi:hypothetical protein
MEVKDTGNNMEQPAAPAPISNAVVISQEQSDANMAELRDRLATMNAAKEDQERTTASLPDVEEPEMSASQGKQEEAVPQARIDAGKADEGKTQKSVQHLEEAIEDKRASLEKYKELQKKFTPLAQQAAAEKKKLEATADAVMDDAGVSDEFRRRFQEDYEKDPLGAIVRLQNAVVDRGIERYRQEESVRAAQKRQMEWLEEQARSGNQWILEDKWIDRISRVLEDNPFLKQSDNPYRDALRFIDDKPAINGRPPSAAPEGPKTPILGVSGAIPPPSARSSGSPEAELEDLNRDLLRYAHNPLKAMAIQKKMDELVSRNMERLVRGR